MERVPNIPPPNHTPNPRGGVLEQRTLSEQAASIRPCRSNDQLKRGALPIYSRVGLRGLPASSRGMRRPVTCMSPQFPPQRTDPPPQRHRCLPCLRAHYAQASYPSAVSNDPSASQSHRPAARPSFAKVNAPKHHLFGNRSPLRGLYFPMRAYEPMSGLLLLVEDLVGRSCLFLKTERDTQRSGVACALYTSSAG